MTDKWPMILHAIVFRVPFVGEDMHAIRLDSVIVHLVAIALLTALTTTLHRAWAAPIPWSSSMGGNDHFYDIFAVNEGVSWSDAQTAAISRGGYLATILSPEENNFIFDNLVNDAKYWKFGLGSLSENRASGPWIGAFQPINSSEPSGGWKWVNGDGALASTYSNWLPGEPNDFENDNRALFFDNDLNDAPTIKAMWNDWSHSSKTPSYVVEYDVTPVPVPVAMPLYVTALATLALIGWGKRKVS